MILMPLIHHYEELYAVEVDLFLFDGVKFLNCSALLFWFVALIHILSFRKQATEILFCLQAELFLLHTTFEYLKLVGASMQSQVHADFETYHESYNRACS